MSVPVSRFAAARQPSSGKFPTGRWSCLAFASVAFFIFGALATFTFAASPAPSADAPLQPAEETSPAPAEAGLREQRVTKVVESGDTLPRLLTDLGVSSAIRNRWHRTVAKELGVHVLKKADTVHFYFTSSWRSSNLGKLTALRIERPGMGRFSWMSQGSAIVHYREAQWVPPVVVLGPAAASEPPAQDTAAEAAKPAKMAETAETAAESKAAPARETAAAPASAATPTSAAAPTSAPARESAVKPMTHVLRRGETLGRVLKRKGVSWNEQQPWIKAISKRYPLKQLFPGRKIVLYFVAAASGGGRTLGALQIESRRGDLWTWQRVDGRIVYRGKNYRVVLPEAAAIPNAAAMPKAAAGPEVAATPQAVAVPKPAETPAVAAVPEPAAAAKPTRPTQGSAAPPPIRSFETLERVTRTIRRGQTLGRIFRPLGVSGKEAEKWFGAIDRQYPVTRLKPGQRLHLYFDKRPARNRRNNLQALELNVSKGRTLTWHRAGKQIRFGKGTAPGRAAPALAVNGATPDPQAGSFLSEYALARIKQRNGLLEYVPPFKQDARHRPPCAVAGKHRAGHAQAQEG